MKFHVAWDSLEKENSNLKILVVSLCALALFLTVAVTNMATKTPLVFERGCATRMLPTAESPPNDEEIKSFAEKALMARFNYEPQGLDYLSLKQRGFREKEQLELSKQKMKQTVIVNTVQVSKDGLVIDADRIVSVSNVRSALRFPLKVQIEMTDRSEANPYGLLLTEVSPLEEEKK